MRVSEGMSREPLIMKKLSWLDILKKTFKGLGEDDITFTSAALAYYTTFSLVPVIVISIFVAGLVLGEETVKAELINQFYRTFGHGSANQISTMITKTMNPKSSVLNQIIAVGVLFFTASGVFGALQTGLNSIWHVKPKSNRGMLALIKDRFLSFAMVLVVSFLLLVSLVVTVLIAAATNYINTYIAGGDILGLILNYVLSTAIITVLFALLFKYLPDVNIKFADVWLGAFVTTLLFTLGKFLLGLYLKFSATEDEFGAAGSLVLILVWVFYSAHIFFLGAEFTKAYATRKGPPIIPTKNAVLVTTKNEPKTKTRH
jgi:membrane protein